MTNEDVTDLIIGFLREIGLTVSETELGDEAFLPGILVSSGELLIDRSRLKYPGDLLHEAGHLAVVPAEQRTCLSGKVDLGAGPMDPYEAAAVAWSYAAALHLNLDPRLVLHADGYMGMGERLLSNFQLGVYLGLPPLIDAGLTRSPLSAGRGSYPSMIKWLA